MYFLLMISIQYTANRYWKHLNLHVSHNSCYLGLTPNSCNCFCKEMWSSWKGELDLGSLRVHELLMHCAISAMPSIYKLDVYWIQFLFNYLGWLSFQLFFALKSPPLLAVALLWSQLLCMVFWPLGKSKWKLS